MLSSTPDLAAAVRVAAAGDEDAFRLLYRAVQPGLIRYLWAHSGDAAGDLAAGTWLRVARGLPRFAGGEDGFRGWVAAIASDLCQQTRRPAACAPVGLLAADDTEDAALEALSVANALEMIAGLPATRAEAVLLTVVLGLDAKTAGRVTGTLPGIVRIAARRGLRRLAGQLGQITRQPDYLRLLGLNDPLQHLLSVAAPEPCYSRELRGEPAAVAAFLGPDGAARRRPRSALPAARATLLHPVRYLRNMPRQTRIVAHHGHMPSPPVSSPETADLSAAVIAAQAGDESAFRLLFRAVQPGLLRYLWAHAGADAEDIAAETWLHVARDLHRFSGDGNGFRGWVTTIARHRFLDHVRKQVRRPPGHAPVELLTALPATDNTEDSVLDTLATANALEMIAGLPATQAEAVLLTVVMALDAKTAGKVMGKRSGAVRVAAHRGLRRLAERLRAPGSPARSPRPAPVERIAPAAENRVTEFRRAAVTGSR